MRVTSTIRAVIALHGNQISIAIRTRGIYDRRICPDLSGIRPEGSFLRPAHFFFRIDFILLLFFFPGIGYLPFHARGVENEIWGEILGEEIIDRDSIVGRRFFEATMIKILSNVKILKKREYWIV